MWQLLLLADPSIDAVKAYLQNGLLFVAFQEAVLCGLFVIEELTEGKWELKNIAVLPTYQRLGIGKQLIQKAEVEVRQRGAIHLDVCTGNSSLGQLAFYQKQGFRMIAIEPDFFTQNYPDPIYENGIQCRDKIRLQKQLEKRI